MAQVELHDLVALARSGVRHGDRRRRTESPARIAAADGADRRSRTSCRSARGRTERAASTARRCTSTCSGCSDRRAAGVLVLVVDRHLPRDAREGDRELPARRDVAEQHVGERVAVLDAEVPALDDRRRCCRRATARRAAARSSARRPPASPARAARTTACASASCEPGQLQRRAARRLAAHVATLAEDEQHGVRVARGAHRLGEARRVAVSTGAPRACRTRRLRQRAANAGEHAHRVLRAPRAAHAPSAERRVVGERADDGDGAHVLAQRERARRRRSFEQHDRLARRCRAPRRGSPAVRMSLSLARDVAPCDTDRRTARAPTSCAARGAPPRSRARSGSVPPSPRRRACCDTSVLAMSMSTPAPSARRAASRGPPRRRG